MLAKAKNDEVIIIDVRPSNGYKASHLSFARSMPLAELKMCLAELPKDKPVIAYCRGLFCLMSTDAVLLLRNKRFEALQLRDDVAESAA